MRMDELNQKKDKDGRITEKVQNRFVVVMLLLLKMIYADYDNDRVHTF